MSTTTKSRNDWDAIRYDYLQGMAVRDIADKYNICYTTISRKAKAKNWGEHNKVGKILDNMIDEVREKTNVDKVIDSSEEYKYLQQQLNITVGSATDDMLRRMIIKKTIVQNTAFDTNIKAYNIINEFLDITSKNLKTSKDGLYTKSIGQGGAVTYASYADDISKAVIPIITENNKALGMTTAQVAIQNNINNGGSDDSAKLVIEYVGNE